MSSRSSISNNQTEFIYQRNNCSRNSWEVSETPSCENLVVNQEFPCQTSMDCNKKLFSSRDSSEDESHLSPRHHLCEFHQRIVHHHSPRRCHHVSKCSTNNERTCNRGYVANSTRQLEELTPFSCRANSYPERICRSTHQDRLNHNTKCSSSSKNVESVENKRNIARTPRSVYTKQPVEVHPQDVRGNTNEGCCKHSSPNVQSPLTPAFIDSGPNTYEKKASKKFCDTSSPLLWNETQIQFPSSSFKKHSSFGENASSEFSRTKAKENLFDPYTTTDYFTKACDSTTVETFQEVPLDRNCRSPVATHEMHPCNSKLQIDRPCSSCIRRMSCRKDSLQSALKEAPFSKHSGKDMMRGSSCNKPNISRCMSAREMPSREAKSSGNQCCPIKCPSQPPLKVSFTCTAADTVASEENVQLKEQVPTRERAVNDFIKDSASKESTCVGKNVHERKHSVMFEGDKPLENTNCSRTSHLKLINSTEKMPLENCKQKLASPMAIAKQSCEQIALKLLSAERPKFPGPRCLLGVSFDDAIIDFLSCFQAPEASKTCKVSTSMDSQVRLKLLTWLNGQYEALGQDCIEAKSQPMYAQGSLSSESLAERKRILDSLSRLIGVKKGCTCTFSEEELMKKTDTETCKRCLGSKVGEHQGADMEDTNDAAVIRGDGNPNCLDRFPNRKCDDRPKKIDVCQSNNLPPFSPNTECSSEDVSINKQEPCLSKSSSNEVQLSIDLKQKIRLCTASQRSPETERSSGYHSEIFEHSSKRGIPLAGPGLNLENRAFSDSLFAKSTARSPSSNASSTSESSQNYRNVVIQQKLPKDSKPPSRANDTLSRITERSSEMRSTDEDLAKPQHVARSPVSFREDPTCRNSELEINFQGSGLNEEPTASYSRQTTPRSILRQYRLEQTNKASVNPECSSQIDESPNTVSIRTPKQYNIPCSPECVSGAARMFMENVKQPLQMCTKPNLEVHMSKPCLGKVVVNKDKENSLQNVVLARNSESAPPFIGKYNVLKRESYPIHSNQNCSDSLQYKNLFPKPDCPCSQKTLCFCNNKIHKNVPFSSQRISNRDSKRNISEVLTKRKLDFHTKILGQCIPNQIVTNEHEFLSSNKAQNFQLTPEKMSASLDYVESGQQGTELPSQHSSRAFKTQCNTHLNSSEMTRNNSSRCTEDCSSRSETCSYEADIDPTQEIGITVQLKKPFEVAHISYSRTIQPKQTLECKKGTCNPWEGPTRNSKQRHPSSFTKPNPINSIIRDTTSISHSRNKSFIDDQDKEKHPSLSELRNSSQCGTSGFKASEAHTSDSARLLDQFSEHYQESQQVNVGSNISTQQQTSITENSNSVPSGAGGSNYGDIIENFPDDQDQPHESIYINSEEELSFCEASYSKARETLQSRISFKSSDSEKKVASPSMMLRRYNTQEPVCISNNFLEGLPPYQPSYVQYSKNIEYVASYKNNTFVDFPDNADAIPIGSTHVFNSNPREGLEAATANKISERETIDGSFKIYSNQENDETTLLSEVPGTRKTDGCLYEDCLQKLPEDFATNANEQIVSSMPMNEQTVSFHQASYSKFKTEKSTDSETRKEIVDATVQEYADQSFETENNETAAFTTRGSSVRRIYDTCLQKCSRIGKLKTELKKLQMLHNGRKPIIDACQSKRPCEFLTCGAVPLRECQTVKPKDFCCELHHKDDSMCVYIDLCNCKRTKENVELYAAHKLKMFHYDNATSNYMMCSDCSSCTRNRTEEDSHFGVVNRAPHRCNYRALSMQTRNGCENHKRSIPRKIKWAVAKISVFDDSSKTYELMQAKPIKPMQCTSNSENIVIVVPENNN